MYGITLKNYLYLSCSEFHQKQPKPLLSSAIWKGHKKTKLTITCASTVVRWLAIINVARTLHNQSIQTNDYAAFLKRRLFLHNYTNFSTQCYFLPQNLCTTYFAKSTNKEYEGVGN